MRAHPDYSSVQIRTRPDCQFEFDYLARIETIDATTTIVKYTHGGDATLDGKLNIDDYVRIDSGISSGLSGWINGDFNYDGKVNIDDYATSIDANIPIVGPPL